MSPLLYDGTTQIELPHDPNYHLKRPMLQQAHEVVGELIERVR